MNYTINETFEMSGYTAVIEADQNLASLITDNFRMEVRDILTNQIEEITKEDLMKWGTSVDTNIDSSLWETQSCINNGGMYINFNGNTLTFKQIIPCLSGDIPIGYNSSQVSVVFNENDSIDFYSKTLPFFKRDLPKSDNYDVEPILPEGSARPDYDFDNFKNNILMNGCKSNFEYNTVGDLYVNNNMGHIKKYNKKSLTDYTKDDDNKQTPKFYSDISAFYITTNQLGSITPYSFIDEYKGKHWSSTIWNEATNEESDILVSKLNQDPLSAIVEFNGLKSDVVYNVYRQVIDDYYFPEEYRKNVLKFYIDFENHGIQIANEPIPLIIEISRETNSKIITVKITNPNQYNGDEPHPLNGAKIYFKEIQKTGISEPYNFNFDKNGNVLTFNLIADVECGYSFIETAWLEKAYPGYGSDYVKTKTYTAVGNNDQPSTSEPGYEPGSVFASVVGYKKYNKDILPPTNIDAFNDATDAEDPSTHNLLLEEDERGIICFEITNKNFDKEWINTNLIQVILNNENLQVSPDVPFDISNNKTYFFVYDITCTELTGTTTNVEITFEISGTAPCSGNWIDQTKSKFDSKWYLSEAIQKISCFTCDDTSDTYPCYEYKGASKNPTIQPGYESYDHILDVYSRQDGTIIVENTEYGIQRFKVVNPNKRDPSDKISITIYKNDKSETFSFAFNDDIPVTGYTLETLGLLVKDINVDYSNSYDYGTLTFNVYGITPSKVKAHVEITTKDMPIANDFFKADSSTVTWSEKSFIPTEWEEYKNYAIFIKSKLHLDGAKIGIRSIYCSAINIDNASTIDIRYSNDPNFQAGIYVTCDKETWSDGSYIILNNANLVDQGLQGSVKYADLNPPIDLKNNSENNVWYNPVSKNVIYLTRDIDKTQYITAVNNNYVGSKMEYKKITTTGELPRFNINYDGTDHINLNDRQSIQLNAGGNIQSYNQFSAGNDCQLTLGAGEYYFKSFTAGTNLQIVIPQLNSGEYVRICVEGKVKVSNGVNLQNNNGDYTTFMLYSDYNSLNDDDYAIKFASSHGSQQNYGVIVAPEGSVRFENGNKWTGAIWSKGLSMANGCELQSAE